MTAQRGHFHRVRRAGRAAAVLALAIAAASPGVSRAAERITVSTAISLKPVVEEIAAGFESRRGIAVTINAGASVALLQQIERGAPVDVYIAASPEELDRLDEAERLLADSRVDLAGNSLVIVVPPGGALPLIPHDLLRPQFDVIAIGNPNTAPLGRYTAESLESLGLADPLRQRFVHAENARQVVEYVASGQVPAGVIYGSDAVRFADRVARGPELPPGSHGTIRYQGAVLAEARDPDACRAFLVALRSARAREILARQGFLPVE